MYKDAGTFSDKKIQQQFGYTMPHVNFLTININDIDMEVYNYQKCLLVEGSSHVITALIKRVLKVRQDLTEIEAEAKKKGSTSGSPVHKP